MKIPLFILLLSLFTVANESNPLLVDSNINLQNYNHKPSLTLKHRYKLKRLARISPIKAKEITAQACKEPVVYQRLTHKGQLLFYMSVTNTCALKINALDGTIISKAQ